ncbi:MAG TPA: AI-2E family transporter [Euzebyales bacterium]|nr:AI-2E family transporter [Euzebyales bacterium]
MAHPPSAQLSARPTIRIGAYAWALLGIVGVLVVLLLIVGRTTLVVLPLAIALFPAAVLTPLALRLKATGMRDAAVAALLVVGTLLAVAGIFTIVVPQVSAEMDTISESVSDGVEQLRDFLARGPFGLAPIQLNDLIDRAQEQIQASDVLQSGTVGSVAEGATRFLTGLILFVLALFFYLKDGPSMAAWLRRQFPEAMQEEASQVGQRIWITIGSYFRGQLLVALIDAVGITIGLLILRVPLALPVGILVFFGSLFPVIGAFVSGFVAVIIALATQGFGAALIVLGIVLGVQQFEGHVLQPLILGRATKLHPLAVIAALIAGGSVLGIVGAFIAVPVTASLWQVIKYLRDPDRPPVSEARPDEPPAGEGDDKEPEPAPAT